MQERFKVAGFQFHKGFAKLLSRRINPEDKVMLLHDPNNKHDENAVAIYHGNDMIGFVPKKINEDILTRFMREGTGFGRVYDVAHPDVATEEPWRACEIIVEEEVTHAL